MTKTAEFPRHGVWVQNDICHWSVWAPRAARMELVMHLHGEKSFIAMERHPQGWFTCTTPLVADGQPYRYRIDGWLERPDPASYWQPEGVHGPSAFWRPDAFRWTDLAWRGVPLDQLVLYELHVGTFTPEGTFDAVIPRLDSLRELGVTALELMPVGQFPGTRGWGYDGVYWGAVQASYGGPSGLQRLVDACHARGLAVLLDAVYNHLGPEGNYLGDFGPCFQASSETPWGEAINYDGRGRDGMRSLALESARRWIRDFHLDGLRLDAVHAIRDRSPVHLLAELRQAAEDESRNANREIHLIAESDQNDSRLVAPCETGGLGLSAQWNDDFHHCVHALVTGERDGYYADFQDPPAQLAKALERVFVYDGVYSEVRQAWHGRPVSARHGARFVAYIQSHDQVGNRPLGERLAVLTTPGQLRLAASLLLCSPYMPLIFMGEEYGERRPFPYFADLSDPELRDAVRRGRREEFSAFDWHDRTPDPFAIETAESACLAWSWPEGGTAAGLRRLYRDLLALRRKLPGFRDDERRSVRLTHVGEGKPLLQMTRGGDRPVHCVFNLSDRAARIPDECLVLKARPQLYSEDAYYRGTADACDSDARRWLRPFECLVLTFDSQEAA
ncbi:MAG: malto-oligosyltrehalose trehalohydrolase [Pirellulales bacterium]